MRVDNSHVCLSKIPIFPFSVRPDPSASLRTKGFSKYKRIYFDKILIENQTVECTHCIQKMSGYTTSTYAANFAQLVSIIPNRTSRYLVICYWFYWLYLLHWFYGLYRE